VTLAAESLAQNSIVVDALTAETCGEWDAYVRSAQDGLPLHLSGWRQVMQKTYGYETRYLMARSGQRIVGVLPLFLVPSRLTGKRGMTMPGGLCADNDAVAISLLEKGLQTAIVDGVDRLLVQDSRQKGPDNWQTESRHVYWLVNLGASEEDLWRGLDGNIRRQVRKAKRNNLEIEVGRDEMLIEPFYNMFSQFTHQAGTPVFSRAFLQNVVDAFPGGYNIALVRYEEQPIAGYFQVEMGDTVYGMWGAALSATLKLRPAYLALWEIMRDAVNNGFTYLDMGRSPAEANASKFKGQWGGKSNPVYQTIIMSNENEHSNSMTSQVQSDERFQLFMQIWPRLPLSLTRYLGPKLRWHIPFA
jgi:FemAB-related protein (PEP-CTERM system-associated)